MKKNILFVIQNDLLGGAEQLLKSLASEYSTIGYSVNVVIMRSPMQNNWNDLDPAIHIKYINTKTYFPGIIKLAFFLICYTRKKKVDLVASSNININALLGLLKKIKLLKTKKLIIRETTSVFLRIKGFKKLIHTIKYLIGYSSADLIICQTELMKQQFLDNLKVSRKWKMITIQNPVNFSNIIQLSTENNSDLLKRKYIVSAGRFIHEKGFDILIKAFAQIAKNDQALDLVILGEGELKKQFENLIRELKLEKRVYMPGFIKNPIPYFKTAEVCVVSSRFEGFPNVLLQMAAVNNKIVSTLCAGNIDSIPSIKTCPTDNISLLAESITEAINKLPDNESITSKFLFLDSISVSNYVKTIENLIYGK